MPAASISVKRLDVLTYGYPGVEELPREVRELLLVQESELHAMSRSEVVIGHFFLPTLLRIAPAASIATVLREPRTRLLSLYAYWRLTAGLRNPMDPHRVSAHALRPLDEFLLEPVVAFGMDNAVCRVLLHGDPRIPPLDFISAEHIEGVASDAIDSVDQLGFVGVLERQQAMWDGLSRFFGSTFVPTRVNLTALEEVPPGYLPVQEPISDRTLDLLHARTAADAIVYSHVLGADVTEDEAKRISDAAFAAQLVRLGDIAGKSAASVQSLTRRLAEGESQIASLAAQLKRREEELARHRAWLEGIQGSVSWRITSPLRAAKRRLLTAKRR